MTHGGLDGMQYHTWLAYLHLNNETRVQKPEIYRNSRGIWQFCNSSYRRGKKACTKKAANKSGHAIKLYVEE